jgi:hypothetical protein
MYIYVRRKRVLGVCEESKRDVYGRVCTTSFFVLRVSVPKQKGVGYGQGRAFVLIKTVHVCLYVSEKENTFPRQHTFIERR